jgi:hypothetical protein
VAALETDGEEQVRGNPGVDWVREPEIAAQYDGQCSEDKSQNWRRSEVFDGKVE